MSVKPGQPGQSDQPSDPDSDGEANASTIAAFLWGESLPGRRGPKPGLTLEAIAQAGIAIADADGLEALSMRRVAEELGYTTMSLYRYVSGKHELIALMTETAMRDGQPAIPADQAWRPGITIWAKATRALFLSHPWLMHVPLQSQATGPERIAWIEAGVALLQGTGLSPEQILEAVLAIHSYVYGVARLDIEWQGSEEEWRIDGPLMRRVAADARFPAMQALLAHGAFGAAGEYVDAHWEQTPYTAGLGYLLDGLEQAIATLSDA